MKRLLSFLLILCTCISLFSGCADHAGSGADASAGDETVTEVQDEHGLTITAFNVGDADALLIDADGRFMLVDTGEADNADFLLAELQKRGVGQLDVLLITHFDKDHVGGAAQILNRISAAQVLYPDYEGSNQEYQDFMDAIAGQSGAAAVAENQTITLGTASMTIYPAEDPQEMMQKENEYDNDLSLVTMLTYGTCRFLLTGDIQKTRIKQLLKTDTDWSCDWIKLPHHGRYEKALKTLLKAAQPAYAVICSAEAAEEKTEAVLDSLQIECQSTAEGNVVTTCDGTSIQMSAEE